MATGTHLGHECFEAMDWQSVFGGACGLLAFYCSGWLSRSNRITLFSIKRLFCRLQADHEIQGFEHHMRGAVAVRGLELGRSCASPAGVSDRRRSEMAGRVI